VSLSQPSRTILVEPLEVRVPAPVEPPPEAPRTAPPPPAPAEPARKP
jgi:hypothetical protein